MIPFLDLQKLNAPYQEKFQENFKSFLNKGWYVLGEEVRHFEQEFAAYCGVKHCIGTANGLDALRMILEGYKILGKLQQGDKVLVAANTYIATILGVKQAGLIPVLVDCEVVDYNFDFYDLSQKITPQCKAIMPTHLYGKLADMEKVSAFAKANNLLIITDCAQAHGARNTDGLRAGNLADASGFSFYPTKNLGALGDAGAITTNDAQLAEILKKYRNYGFKQRYVAEFVGINSRLDELQAAFLRIKLKDLDLQNQRRQEIATLYFEKIKNPAITLPTWDGGNNHVFHLFVIRCEQRDLLQEYLKEKGIATIIHYPVPPHKQEALKAYSQESLPVTELVHNQVLSIPLNPVMSTKDIEHIITTLNAFVC